MDETKVLLSIVRNNERQVLCLLAQKYERKSLFPQLTEQQFQVFKNFLKDQEKIHDLIIQAVKLLVCHIITTYHKIGEAPLTEENVYCERLLFLLDSVFKHGLKLKRTFTGYSKPYWCMITEAFSAKTSKPPLLGISFSEGFPEYFGHEKENCKSDTEKAGYLNTSSDSMPHLSAFERITANKKISVPLSSVGWFMLLLNEKSLSQHLSALTFESSIIREWYEPYAFLNQEQVYKLYDLLSPLSSVDFNFQIKASDIERILSTSDEFIPEKSLLSWLTDVIADTEAALEGSEYIPSQEIDIQVFSKVLSDDNLSTHTREASPIILDSHQHLLEEVESNCLSFSSSIQESQPSLQTHPSSPNELSKEAIEMLSLLQRKVLQLESETNLLRRANIQCLAEVNQYKSLAQDYKAQVASLKADNTRLELQLKEEVAAHKDADSKFQDLGSQLALVLKELSAARAQTIKLQKSSDSTYEMNHILQEQLHASQKDYAHLQEQLSSSLEQLSLIEEQKEQLMKDIIAKEQLLDTVAGEMAKSKLELKEVLLEQQLSPSYQKFISRVESKLVTNCTNCQVKFSILVRKHHCRRDGKVYCDACTSHRVNLPSHKKPERVCDKCYSDILRIQGNLLPFESNS